MKGYSRIVFLSPLLYIVVFFNVIQAVASDNLNYPLRAQYSHLKPIETTELTSIYSNAIIIDARYQTGYNVVHMEGAKNILVSHMSEGNLLALRPKTSNIPFVFYCNGTTCEKSYEAADKATKWGFKNVRVYDPGIFFWAKKMPQKALFFGEKMTPQSIKTSFLSKEKFNSHLLSTADFINKAKGGGFTLIDSRDIEDIQKKPIEMKKIKKISSDLMTNLLKKKSWMMPTSNILVIDNVGKEVMWLQYYFEKEGVTNYYFLKGGVRQWFADGYDKKGNI